MPDSNEIYLGRMASERPKFSKRFFRDCNRNLLMSAFFLATTRRLEFAGHDANLQRHGQISLVRLIASSITNSPLNLKWPVAKGVLMQAQWHIAKNSLNCLSRLVQAITSYFEELEILTSFDSVSDVSRAAGPTV